MKTGFIGLGTMGQGMARNLHRAGLLAALYNRSAPTAAALAAELGCPQAASPAALAAQCQAIVVCVSADADVLEVIQALAPALQPGQLVIDCSTVSRATAQAAAARVAAQGAGFLDAPVSGGSEGAKKATLTIMCGGSAADFQRAQPVLAAMGQRIEHMGAVGSGQATKAVNQVLAAGINQAVCEALAFATALQLPLDQVIDVIGSGAAGNWFINHRGKTMTRGHYSPGFKLALHQKDLGICQAMAARVGTQLPLAEQTRAQYAQLQQQGFADEDISALFRLFTPSSSSR